MEEFLRMRIEYNGVTEDMFDAFVKVCNLSLREGITAVDMVVCIPWMMMSKSASTAHQA